MAGTNSEAAAGTRQQLLSTKGWTTERWVAIITLTALILLIAIRRGFRGVNLLGVKASVG